ncbi:MAG: putative Na+/H+ antiporter [Bdellovibrionales bacterium]|nr:putative Na+/H+ antiporter [Bdellovibrionales bacterium]
MMETMELVGTICFGSALVHTFLVKTMQHLALRYPSGSVLENLFHLLGEVEIVFGLWAGLFLIWLSFWGGDLTAVKYLEKQNFTEPAFVFVILVVCSSKPILSLARGSIHFLSKLLPLRGSLPFFITTLIFGPLLGSFITEPAAMTITAILLLEHLFQKSTSLKLKYSTLGLLFVNVSIGGTLTPFAAPPVLMVASQWRWDLRFMMTHFGWKAIAAVVIATLFTAFRFRKELMNTTQKKLPLQSKVPLWVSGLHFLFMVLIIVNAHHMSLFILLFLFFLGLASVTKEFQNELKIKEGLLVAFFLGGLVILGGMQRWWLEPLLGSMNTVSLYLGAMSLTAFTDNAALTFLGAQVPTLSEYSKYALVAGSVVGGGLTVIANAPNPAGYGILNHAFGEEGISPWLLFTAALIPTLVAAFCFWPLS